jgi:hypothetical protein
MADDDDQWRFSIDDVGPDDEDEDATVGANEGDTWGTTVDERDDESDTWGTTVGEDDDGPTVALGGAGEEAADEGGNVAGTIAPDVAVEPGMPDFENVVFATVGAIFTAVVLAGLVTPLEATTVATIAGVIGFGAGLLYALFRRF